jgi:peptidoglycan biosynthesis protein MviN/MurJ (putative lipid II flippase)
VQVLVLAGPAKLKGYYQNACDLRHPGLGEMVRLQWPLIASGVFSRCTQLVDRHAASSLITGSIARLNYATLLTGVASNLVFGSLATVFFPKIADQAGAGDLSSVRASLRQGIIWTWALAAPSLTVGWVLAEPLIHVLFVRGRFSEADGAAVSHFFRIYLIGMVGGAIGNVTGRVFYALKDTRTPSVMGVFEGLAYVVYTPILAKHWGPTGIVWASVIFLNGSVLWQIALHEYRFRAYSGVAIVKPLAIIGAVAGGAALVGQFAISPFHPALARLTVGVIAGAAFYVSGLFACGMLRREAGFRVRLSDGAFR